MTLRTVAASFALSLACALPCFSSTARATTEDFVVTGSATCRERITLTPGAKFEATLEDASRGGKVIARDRRGNPGQVPIDFRIMYDPRRMDPRHDYVVRATVSDRGRARFAGESSYRMPANGHGKRVRVMMRAVMTGGRPGLPGDRERQTRERRSSGRVEGLRSGRWSLSLLDGRAVRMSTREREPWIELDARAMKVSGSGGCNRISGDYESAGSALRFGRLISTRMACASLDVEQAFIRALERTRQYRIHGRTLDLMDDRGELLAQMEERNP